MLQGIALRGLFIIDKEGIIQHSTINNLGIGRSVDETKRTLQVIIQLIRTTSRLNNIYLEHLILFVRFYICSTMYITSLFPWCAFVLQALQYVQENPDEVCPAGWKPGEKSMKPDPKLSKDYFAAV